MSAPPADPPTAPPRAWEPFRRASEHRLLGGVCAGLADHLGLPTGRARWAFRFLFAIAAIAGGLGAVLYVAYWIVVPPSEGTNAKLSWLQWAAAGVAGVILAVTLIRTTSVGQFFVPLALAALGGALVWRQATENERERWRRISTSSLSVYGDRIGLLRLAGGIVLVIGGGVLILAQNSSIGDLRNALAILIVVSAGFALITGPYWVRAVTALSDERRARIRSQEREEIAAHLHDSVLQTLALIQRNANSPREVARLARGQERELRTLLYRDRPTGTFAAAMHDAVGEVEDGFAVSVDEVVVGDVELDEPTWALVQAAREAMVNAGKHAGVDSISLYAEIDDAEIVVYVRDRGRGFDPGTVPDDRQGLRGSVVGRMERHGGSSTIRSSPETGTEVELHMPMKKS